MKKKSIRIILHITAWLLLLGLPLISSSRLQIGNEFLLIYYTFTVINVLIFYFNYLLLVPKFFFRRRRYKYYFTVLALMICFYIISDFSGRQIISHISEQRTQQFQQAREEGRRPLTQPPPRVSPGRIFTQDTHLIGYLSSASFMIFLSLGLRVLERQSKIEKMQEEMERAKLNAELAFLKNQISPHFFFNTLNNIYSLIGINAEDSQKAVLKLSKLMRYLLYESEHGDTKLSYEIDFMNNYIDLMKLRMNEKVSLSVDFPWDENEITIPPLLFIPFIENAFKHGITTRGKSYIDICLFIKHDVLIFKCSNSMALKGSGDRQPGIGLGNAKKRLALLFPGKHDLVIEKHEDEFRVLLNIKLS
jgi:two-component system, LytTR family, sensor kinase